MDDVYCSDVTLLLYGVDWQVAMDSVDRQVRLDWMVAAERREDVESLDLKADLDGLVGKARQVHQVWNYFLLLIWFALL